MSVIELILKIEVRQLANELWGLFFTFLTLSQYLNGFGGHRAHAWMTRSELLQTVVKWLLLRITVTPVTEFFVQSSTLHLPLSRNSENCKEGVYEGMMAHGSLLNFANNSTAYITDFFSKEWHVSQLLPHSINPCNVSTVRVCFSRHHVALLNWNSSTIILEVASINVWSNSKNT